MALQDPLEAFHRLEALWPGFFFNDLISLVILACSRWLFLTLPESVWIMLDSPWGWRYQSAVLVGPRLVLSPFGWP